MKKNKLENTHRNIVEIGRHGIKIVWDTSYQAIMGLFVIIMKELNTPLGRINLGIAILIFFAFLSMHLSNFVKNILIIVFSKDITIGNGDKLFYSMIIFFAFSLILVAFDNKKK